MTSHVPGVAQWILPVRSVLWVYRKILGCLTGQAAQSRWYARSMTATDAAASRAVGKVVVNRAMSLDGFIAGPGHAMDWVFDYTAPDTSAEVMGATGAMLAGRNT